MNDKYIKLSIGLVLFATLVALTILQTPHSERLVDMLYGALVGMGIMHIGQSTSTPTAPPADKQSGRASVAMLATVAGAGLLLAACATNGTSQSTQVTHTQACASWGAAFSTALELRRAGKLNRAQIDQITLLDATVNPICTGPLPADPTVASQQVTAAVTTLVILEAVKKGN